MQPTKIQNPAISFGRYEPFGTVGSMTMPFTRGLASPPLEESLFRTGGAEILNASWTPAVDICETSDEILVEADLPGVEKKAIRVNVDEGRLIISGERQFSGRVQDENYHRIEKPHGPFARSFMLPASADAAKITAQHKDGVLTVCVPKRNGGKAHGLEVKVV
jgi:HSP20 family protein